MDIHKPKPAHTVREFLTEIGTIVCGILIALGLEQTIEAWHWHEVVSEEREALRDEVGQLRGSMMGRFELDPCFVERLADVKEIIRRHDTNTPLGIAGPVGRPLYPPTPRPLWELAVADQSLAHMKLSEKKRFTAAYNWMSVYEPITDNERTAWRELQVLNHADQLTLTDWSAVREAYEHAAETHEIIAGSAQGWLSPFTAISGETPTNSVRRAPPVKAFCTSMLAKAGRP